MVTAELILGLVKLGLPIAASVIEKWVGRAKFADGSVLTQADIDAAKASADAPWQTIEDTAQAELDKLPKKPNG